MKDIETFIDDILENKTKYDEFIFSIYDHILDEREAQNSLMCYTQAVKENKLELFERYRTIYHNSFEQFYNQFNEEFLIHSIYNNNSDIPQNREYINKKEYTDGIDVYYKCKNINNFLEIIDMNLKEILPFQNLVFKMHHIYVEFNFDLTFKVIFRGNEILTLEKIKKLFLDEGFYLIAKKE